MIVPHNMKAWTCRRYGGPEGLALEDVSLRALKRDELLIRVAATTVSSADSRIRALRLPRGFGPIGRLIFGLRGPRQPVLGIEACGVIVAVGCAVSKWQVGDTVIAFPDTKMGGHADYLIMPDMGMVAHKPQALSVETAASLCFGGLTAHHFLSKANIIAGERLLVIGAAGTVGSAMVQLARQMGAHVTAVVSPDTMVVAQDLGVDAIIDYCSQDFMALGQCWDVIADTVAASDFARCTSVLNDGGRYLAIAGGLSDMLTRGRGSKRSISGPSHSTVADLDTLVQMASAGAFTPVIDSVYRFDQMPEAHARTDTGRKRGSVVVIADSHAR